LSQPLQATLLNNEFARQEIETQPLQLNTLRTVLAEQNDSINRMVDTINTMRGVFTATESKPNTVDLFDVVDRLKPLITPQAEKNNIQIEYLRSGSAAVKIKVSEIQQALLNLATNAIQALTTQGIANPKIRIHVVATESCVRCQIEDNGNGIPSHMHNDLFKFLTKSNTSGMGLGLWLTKYIVERNAGTISAGVSDLGGAMFTIQLPKQSS
jgi:C4-dicarboxylate-specific signal transduction histidine kinase